MELLRPHVQAGQHRPRSVQQRDPERPHRPGELHLPRRVVRLLGRRGQGAAGLLRPEVPLYRRERPVTGQEQEVGHQLHHRAGEGHADGLPLRRDRGHRQAQAGSDYRGRPRCEPTPPAGVQAALLQVRRGDGAVPVLLRRDHAAACGGGRRVPPHRGDQQHAEQGRPHSVPAAVREEWLHQIQQETQDPVKADDRVPDGQERRRAGRPSDGGQAGAGRQDRAQGRLQKRHRPRPRLPARSLLRR